jgi:hypothetical protein
MSLNKNYVGQVTREQVIKNYAEHGHVINVDQANQILEFMYMFADIALEIAEDEMKKENQSGSNSQWVPKWKWGKLDAKYEIDRLKRLLVKGFKKEWENYLVIFPC